MQGLTRFGVHVILIILGYICSLRMYDAVSLNGMLPFLASAKLVAFAGSWLSKEPSPSLAAFSHMAMGILALSAWVSRDLLARVIRMQKVIGRICGLRRLEKMLWLG